MKKFFLYVTLFAVLNVFADESSIVKMAVFSDNTVFTVRKAVFPEGRNSLSFFSNEQFFKGSFSLWSKDVQFGIKDMPRKQFNADVYSNPNAAFADHDVIVTLKKNGNQEQIISGKLIKIENPDNPYEISSVIAVQDKNSKKITYIRKHDIETIQAEKADFMNEIVPAKCWIFSRENTENSLPFEFSYLSDGIDWQSNIELHLKSKDKMSIIHNAVIRNNGKKFDCPDFYLVSGSPEITTKNIISLLCQNLLSKRKNYNAVMGVKKSAMNDMGMALYDNAVSFIFQEGDIFYRRLGRVAMEANESRLVKLQSADNVPYRTVVKWKIPASRDTYGRVVSNNNRQTAFNTLIFKNLCPTMLDSAPAAIYADNKLMMLSVVDSNTPVGAERSVRLSKADGIKCIIRERELVEKRVQNVIFNNRRYVKCTVEADIEIIDYRKEKSAVDIDFNFNGEFVKCNGAEGTLTQIPDGQSIINPKGNLEFNFELGASQSRKIKVIYTILADGR